VYEQCGRTIDLVMTDMVLPGRTGQELGQDVRDRSPEVAVLVTSGYGGAAYETESPEAGTYFLAKPYSRRALVEKIETILKTDPKWHPSTQAS
jgi:FixJ family two-component response regulator